MQPGKYKREGGDVVYTVCSTVLHRELCMHDFFSTPEK